MVTRKNYIPKALRDKERAYLSKNEVAPTSLYLDKLVEDNTGENSYRRISFGFGCSSKGVTSLNRFKDKTNVTVLNTYSMDLTMLEILYSNIGAYLEVALRFVDLEETKLGPETGFSDYNLKEFLEGFMKEIGEVLLEARSDFNLDDPHNIDKVANIWSKWGSISPYVWW